MDRQLAIDFSPLKINNSRWWQTGSFRLVFLLITLHYAVLLFASGGIDFSNTETFEPFSVLTSIYIIAITVTIAASSSSSGAKRSRERLERFATKNGFTFEAYDTPGFSAGISGKDVTTKSIMLEALHLALRGQGSNKKTWEIRGTHNGRPFKIYVILLAIRFGSRFPRWYYAGVVQIQHNNTLPSFIALARRDMLTPYLTENDLAKVGLRKLADLGNGDRKAEYTYYPIDLQSVRQISPKLITDPLAKIARYSIESSDSRLFIIKDGGFYITEKEITKTFEMIDTATRVQNNDLGS